MMALRFSVYLLASVLSAAPAMRCTSLGGLGLLLSNDSSSGMVSGPSAALMCIELALRLWMAVHTSKVALFTPRLRSTVTRSGTTPSFSSASFHRASPASVATALHSVAVIRTSPASQASSATRPRSPPEDCTRSRQPACCTRLANTDTICSVASSQYCCVPSGRGCRAVSSSFASTGRQCASRHIVSQHGLKSDRLFSALAACTTISSAWGSSPGSCSSSGTKTGMAPPFATATAMSSRSVSPSRFRSSPAHCVIASITSSRRARGPAVPAAPAELALL
mmetsp:Transcript_45984/g.116364  ORF Transcript_45984/g.116364 Transcript_45984/m.116364 type:complete len:280 (-) Transcript_45984:96-935(-)